MHGAGSSLEEILRLLSTDGQLVEVRRIPGREPMAADVACPLPEAVARLVPPGGLWSHQATAIDLIRAGRSVALSTGTASGKSLCYQLPIAEAACAGSGTALIVVPTKALAHDQLRALRSLGLPALDAVAYDGDSTGPAKAWARRHAAVVLTNPDMLHAGILPFHGRWVAFLRRLRYVVLDELHTLRGVYGTHVAHLVRRLRRLCALYGSTPTFVCCSATIGRPEVLAEAILGMPVCGVTADGSPSGERLFALWNPASGRRPSGAPGGWGSRASAHGETSRLLAGLVGTGHRAIAFTRSRRGAEIVAAGARTRLAPAVAASVTAYRGGYLPEERRQIEEGLAEGNVRGVATTNALELGIDIGGLDACILDGFPGTIASMWQQVGRAGRTRQRSLAVLVAAEDALDQWLMAHPDEVFGRAPEPAVINLTNPFVLEPHVACAAYERPLEPADRALWGPELDEAVCTLVVGDQLTVEEGNVAYRGPTFPASLVGLRSGSGSEYRILDGAGKLIGTVDGARAFTSVHPGAIYVHQGQHYRVSRLDIDARLAVVAPTDGAEWTQAITVTEVAICSEDRTTTIGRCRLSLGRVEVTQQVVGYQRRTRQAVGVATLAGGATGVGVAGANTAAHAELSLPPVCLATRALWYVVGDHVLGDAGLARRPVEGALHAVEHAAIGMLPLFTMCDRWDVGGLSTPAHAQTGEATIFVYDAYVGGAGIAELGFEAGEGHLRSALAAVAACVCEHGCPSCVHSPTCGTGNEPLDKSGALTLLRAMLDGP